MAKSRHQKEAEARQSKNLARHDAKYETLHKTKNCEFCGRSIVVNNYEDGKSRTPRWMGYVICPWCDPSSYTGRITKPTLYKTIMARVLVEKLATMNYCFKEAGYAPENCKCLGCAARKLVAITEERMGI